MRELSLGFLVVVLAASGTVHAQGVPAFPGAEGYGAASVGGRGGTVHIVRNRCDYKSFELSSWPPSHCTEPGALPEETLRWGVDLEGPRTIVFEVGGTIQLRQKLEIDAPYITIAGQTAPGEGITLRNRHPGAGISSYNLQTPLSISTHDVVIRHIRVRPGPGCDDALGDPQPEPPYFPTCPTTETLNAVAILDGSDRVILDHVSMSWSVDQVLSTWDGPGPGLPRNTTIQHSIVAEGLDRSVHGKGAHSTGILLDGGEDISLHHNLLTRNSTRNPLLNATGRVEFVSNLVFGFGFWAANATNAGIIHPLNVDFRDNFYHQANGPSASRFGREHVPSASPHLILSIHDSHGFDISQSSDPADRSVDPAFTLFSDGNLFWNPDGYPTHTTNGFDDHADVPQCRDLSGPGYMSLDGTTPWCTSYEDSGGMPREYTDLLTASSPVATGQAWPVTPSAADDLEALLADVGATLPSRDVTDTRLIDRANDFQREPGSGRIDDYPVCGGDCTACDCTGIIDAPPMDYGTSPWPPPSTELPAEDLDGDGYTNLEEYLNGTRPFDTDDDGFGDAEDCAPADAGAFAVPAEVAGVVFHSDRTTVRWESAAPGAGSTTVHDVLRGGLEGFPVGSGSGETCVDSGTAGDSASDATEPPAELGFWYLVRGRNVCGAGSYGRASDDAERISAVCP